MSEHKEQNEELEVKGEDLEEALLDLEESDKVTEPENETIEETQVPEKDEEVQADIKKSEEAEASDETEKVEEVAEEDLDAQIANLNNQDAAGLLIKKAKHIVHDAENQMEECKVLLSDDLKDFEIAKESLKKGGMDECEEMLETLGYSGADEGKEEEEAVVFETKEEVSPVYIRDVSSGKFTGFLLALIFGLATLIGLVYIATEKIGMTLNPNNIASIETHKSILAGLGSLVGMNNPMVGGAILAVAVLLVMWIVYKIRVSIKAASNLSFAKEQLKKAEEYAALKGTCKDEMDSIDAHIKDAIETLKNYEVILHEQKGKLKRIHHLEKSDEESTQYHAKSLKEMEDTYDLIKTIKEFLNTPMSEEGKLSGKSTLFLYRAKNHLDKMIESLY
ncbi:hypothetical protein [Sulfurovum sp. NBC37-1]|uniref:hypothetical protein n=1 Tax=Sulfurovum sp. (strain NBC37-1) TaxID=387093 RepID=UPI00015878BC|nr:hypothetical protein [Sulfurovum sp. NBC37-1]BAF71715.1 hypothetical protein SUN_0757 [Sulfurovum sp. NBC37-1]